MAVENKEKFRLYRDTFNEQSYSDHNMLANALLLQADTLSPVITHLAGREDQRFPLSMLTEGNNNLRYTKGIEYEYPVIGRLKRISKALTLVAGTGENHTRFRVIMDNKQFAKSFLIECGHQSKWQARVMSEPVERGTGWELELQLNTTDPNAKVSAAIVEGFMFSHQFSPNAFAGSRGNESRSTAPSKMRNQKSLIRKSYRFEGNLPKEVTVFEFNIPGKGQTKLWYPFEEWQHMLQWKEECENLYWYSVYNRDVNGVIHLKDENGNDIPLGAGVLDQIPNKDSYGILTANKLKQVVRDAIFGASDAEKMDITLFTGTGGMEEFDNAMKQEVSNGTFIKNTPGNLMISGSGRNLVYGGFFTSYQHIDGHTITVQKVPLFDYGSRAEASELHPVTGLPMESYRMVFLDQSIYDGKRNIQMISTEGRSLVRKVINGMVTPPGFEGNAVASTDVDGASVHFLKEAGININRATNCLHLECRLS